MGIIEGKQVYVMDDLVSDSSIEVMEGFMADGFKKGERANADVLHSHFICEVRKSLYEDTSFDKLTKQKISELFSNSEVYRVYINSNVFGDQTFIHKDNDGNKGVSILAFLGIDKSWLPDWGGETMFYDNNFRPQLAVLPKKNRVIIFDSRINHVGKPPNKIATNARYTLAVKLK